MQEALQQPQARGEERVRRWQRPQEKTAAVRKREEGARSRGAVLISFAKPDKTNEQLKDNEKKRKQPGNGTQEPKKGKQPGSGTQEPMNKQTGIGTPEPVETQFQVEQTRAATAEQGLENVLIQTLVTTLRREHSLARCCGTAAGHKVKSEGSSTKVTETKR